MEILHSTHLSYPCADGRSKSAPLTFLLCTDHASGSFLFDFLVPVYKDDIADISVVDAVGLSGNECCIFSPQPGHDFHVLPVFFIQLNTFRILAGDKRIHIATGKLNQALQAGTTKAAEEEYCL